MVQVVGVLVKINMASLLGDCRESSYQGKLECDR